ncbi:hypothetical protein B0T22DRAFT_62839 [Podospora appendiculata]|uniref:Oxidoreductase n=1 Tax=Podospora appendiculata TaxID=314037 RepID=A0AAE1CH48_9PEZI|nr:hypothetical protein B0T22DRAFT_62839 [Podospora appendiculata]
MPNLTFDYSTIPDLAGRVVLVTGGTGGIGAEVIVELAKHNPSRILFTGRNAAAANTTIQRAQAGAPTAALTFVPCDLASLSSVKAAAASILAQTSRLDVFLANAGIMARPAGLSADGYEIQLATNHLGHALLTKLLLPLLSRTASLPGADVRVLYTSSTAWRGGRLACDATFKTPMSSPLMGRWLRYCNTKLANLLYARELAARYPEILAFSLTPGVVGTALVTDLGFGDRAFIYVSQLGRVLTPEQGSWNHLWGISVPRGQVARGAFYEPVGVLAESVKAVAKEAEVRARLWEWTERELAPWME